MNDQAIELAPAGFGRHSPLGTARDFRRRLTELLRRPKYQGSPARHTWRGRRARTAEGAKPEARSGKEPA